MTTVIALGDLHSQLATLPRLKRVQAKYPDAITVFIGDYIDTYGINHGFVSSRSLSHPDYSNKRQIIPATVCRAAEII